MVPHSIESLAITGATAGAITATFSYVTFGPRCGIWGPVVFRGATTGAPTVALTFDDGPLPGSTERVLDVLAELEVKAAFFVIGRRAREHPDLLRRIHHEGHLIGNHSFNHRGLGFLGGVRYWRSQLERTDAAIEAAVGLRPRLFRPPLGIKTPAIVRAAAGRTIVTWTRRGFDGVSTNPRRILRRLVPHARPGDILALHDGLSPQSRRNPTQTIDALRPLIDGLRARNLRFARLDDLIGSTSQTLGSFRSHHSTPVD